MSTFLCRTGDVHQNTGVVQTRFFFFKLKNLSTFLLRSGGPDSFWILSLTLWRKWRAMSDEVTHMATTWQIIVILCTTI